MKTYRRIRYGITSGIVPYLVRARYVSKIFRFRPYSDLADTGVLYMVSTLLAVMLTFAPHAWIATLPFLMFLFCIRCTSIVLPCGNSENISYEKKDILRSLLKYGYAQTGDILGHERAVALYSLMCRVCVAGVLPDAIITEFRRIKDELENGVMQRKAEAQRVLEHAAMREISHDTAEGPAEGKLLFGSDAALLVEKLRSGTEK